MKADNCACTTTTADVCVKTPGERPRYFPRQLVTAEDLMLEQDYFRNRMRLHNRLLHGWGVVCGLDVAPVRATDNRGMEPWKVRIGPGHALGPYGDDIIVPCVVPIDLRQDSVSGSSLEPCGATSDVWCSDVLLDRSEDRRLYIAIKYAEVPARPVRVQPVGCGCDDNTCENSRLLDGYQIKVLTEVEYRPLAPDLSKLPDWRGLFKLKLDSPPNDGDPIPCCWPCPDHPWVVLACIRIDGEGKILSIDNCGPRRLVAALGCFYWSCAKTDITSISTLSPLRTFECGIEDSTPITLNPGSSYMVNVSGAGFQEGLKVDFGSGITAIPESFDKGMGWPGSFSIGIRVEREAAAGTRDVLVINTDCSTAFCSGAIEIPADSSVTTPGAPPPPDRPRPPGTPAEQPVPPRDRVSARKPRAARRRPQ